MTPQQGKILQYLRKHGSIEPLEGLHQCGSYRLAARIYELRQMGHKIETVLVRTIGGDRIAQYHYMGGPKDGKH